MCVCVQRVVLSTKIELDVQIAYGAIHMHIQWLGSVGLMVGWLLANEQISEAIFFVICCTDGNHLSGKNAIVCRLNVCDANERAAKIISRDRMDFVRFQLKDA